MNIFITGTDTECGKTYTAVKIIKKLVSEGYNVAGFKPVASGCESVNGVLYNEDALQLQAASNIDIDYEFVNPLRFKEPIAPHIAAEKVGMSLTKDLLVNIISEQINYSVADFNIIEGAGGWLLPLNYSETLADVVVELNLEVILVVGMRFGCINHALLTAEAIKNHGANFLGWIANDIDKNMLEFRKVSDTLKKFSANLIT